MKYKAIGENHLYQKTYARGMKAVAKTVVVYCLRDYAAAKLQKAHPQNKRANRVGLTVTKKIGGAVTRSRVKRILREGFRRLDTETPLKTGFLVVLVARDAAVTAKSQDIYADLRYAFRKLGMVEGMPFPPKETQDRPKPKKKPASAT
ncbi:MAG: ribonuclease P protein component [Ruminococcaceae bacterium]|nr:ribonuclease P protein component [Oscillospiraceae bacterium]